MINALWLIPAVCLGAAGSAVIIYIAIVNAGEGETEESRLGRIPQVKTSPKVNDSSVVPIDEQSRLRS